MDIGPLSAQLQSLESSLENVQVVDTARVEAIKQAITEGRFRVNPDVVADRLLTTVKELVNHKAEYWRKGQIPAARGLSFSSEA